MTEKEINEIFSEIEQQVSNRPKEWREGQAWYNYAWAKFPEMHHLKVFSEDATDPFYNSSKVETFKEALRAQLLASGSQYKSSITLNELINKLTSYKIMNPGLSNTPIYFDCLSIQGKVINYNEYLELI